MRGLVVACVVGCSQPHQASVDAAIDAFQQPIPTCTASPASLTAGATTYARVVAGGVEEDPFLLWLVFAHDDDVSACCYDPSQSCCDMDVVSITTENLPLGGELGSHTATVSNSTTTGTVTITDWIEPTNTPPPGHVTGSLSFTGPSSMTGTFDVDFCRELLVVPL